MPGRAAWTVGTRILLARSCSICLELKPASEFRVLRNGSRQAQCKICQYHSSKKSERVTNDHTIAHANRKGEAWTEYEINELRRLSGLGWATKDIAYRLKRTAFSIQTAKARWVDKESHENRTVDHGAHS